SLAESPEGQAPSLGSSRLPQWLESVLPLPAPRMACLVGKRETKRWYRRRGSIAHSLRLVVIRGVPLELAHQLEQALLSPSCNEFLQCFCDRGFLGAFAADFERALDQIWIDRQVCSHV